MTWGQGRDTQHWGSRTPLAFKGTQLYSAPSRRRERGSSGQHDPRLASFAVRSEAHPNPETRKHADALLPPPRCQTRLLQNLPARRTMPSRLLGITPKAQCTPSFPGSPNCPLGRHFKRCPSGRRNISWALAAKLTPTLNWGRGPNVASLRACWPGPQPLTPADGSPGHGAGQCCRSTPTPHVLLQAAGPRRPPSPAPKKYLRQNEAAVGRPARWKAGCCLLGGGLCRR